MDLIPKPDQVASAAGNVAHMVLYGGLADLRPMPRTLIDEGSVREVYHYRPAKNLPSTGDPILLVTPLAAPSMCFDLRRGCSVVEHFVNEGRPTYLVEYGEISFGDRSLGIEHWVTEVVPEAIKAVSAHTGGRPVHLVGWSLGGIFSVLTAANDPSLPIASLTVIGSPMDLTKVPLVAPLRPLLRITDGAIVSRVYRVFGGAPKPIVRRAFQLSSGTKVITKPLAKLQHLDDKEWLAQIEAVDHFTANMIAYPGRTFGQMYHRILKSNQLSQGFYQGADHTIRIENITAPVLVLAGSTDGIAPIAAVRPLTGLLPKSHEVRFEVVPGGHLGMLTGRAARGTTWMLIDEWVQQHSSPDKPTGVRGGKEPTTGAAGSTAPSSRAKRETRVAPQRSTIGSNPARRYASQSSRDLRKKG